MYQGKHYVEKKKRDAKSIVLAIVAMIELLLLCVTMTFSWFEGTTALRITTDYDNFPGLKTATGLKSSFTVGGEDSKYSNTAELNEYIEMQANAKFSPVSSYNGEDFYALMDGTADDGNAPDTYDEYFKGANDGSLKFRKLSDEEKNSSLVYFQFQVTAATSNTDFWLRAMPTFKINGKALDTENNPFRIRIDDGTADATPSSGNYNILTTKYNWPNNGPYQINTENLSVNRQNMLAIKELKDDNVANLKKAADNLGNRADYYVFNYNVNPNTNNKESRNKNGNSKLFTVKKGETKTITMAIWLEALDQSYSSTLIPAGATVDVDIQFCSSWDVIDTITFRDYTSEQWINNNSNKKNWLVNNTTGNGYEMSYTSNGTTTSTVSKNTWTVDIPRAVQDITFRCEDEAYDTDPPGKWTPATRGTNTTFTAFGSTAGVWYDGAVTEISFTDGTTKGIVSQSANKMKCQIVYNNVLMEYSMAPSATDTKTWTAFIPSDLGTVIFNAYDNSDNHKYVWNGIERGTHNDYYAIDGEQTEVPFNGVVVYFDLSDVTDFYSLNQPVFVSLTSPNNKTKVDQIYANGYCPSGNSQYIPKEDTWPAYNEGQKGEMVRVGTSDLWYFVFDKIEPGTNVTFWSKGAVDFNNIDNDLNFADTTYTGANSTYKLTSSVTLSGDGISKPAKRYFGSWTNDADDGGTTVVPDTTQNGRWGRPELVAGTYRTHFVHASTTTSVKATFTYEGMTYTIDLTNEGDSKYWVAQYTIPNNATNIKFTDASGITWITGTDRSTTKNYYYATGSAGVWSSKITGTKQFHFMHLYDDVTSMTAKYTYNGVTFTFDMTKSSSNAKLWSTPASVPENFTDSVVFTDNSGREWTATGGNSSNNNYCFAIDHPANSKDTDSYKWRDSANYMRVYFTNNKSWNNLKIHYWGNSASTTWPGDSLTMVNNNSDSQAVYVKVIPTGSTIIFNNGGSSTQTVDITGVTDMNAYYISNDSNKYTVGTWTLNSSFFSMEG